MILLVCFSSIVLILIITMIAFKLYSIFLIAYKALSDTELDIMENLVLYM